MRFLPLAAITLVGCVKPASEPDAVQSIVRRCGLEGQIEFTRLQDTRLVVSRLDEKADIKRFECVLDGLAARGIKVGFIGREQINN